MSALNITRVSGVAVGPPASLFAGGQQGIWLGVVQSGGFSPALLFAGGQQGILFELEG